MLHALLAADLQDVERSSYVRDDIRVGVRKRIANTRLRAEMNDAIETDLPEEPLDRIAIGKIPFMEIEVPVPQKNFEASELELDLIIVVQIVETDDIQSPREQR